MGKWIFSNLIFLDWLYSPCGPWPLFSFLIHSQLFGLLRWVISSSQGLYLNTGQHKHRKTHVYTKLPCRKWDLNPRSQHPSEQRQFMPETAWLPWSASHLIYFFYFTSV
jgi:hypothetical protein